MLTPDRTGRSEGKDDRKAIERQSKMAKLVKCNKPIKKTIPQLYTRVYRVWRRKIYLLAS